MRVGICGGTFDPFHRGHLEPILAVREAMEWDRVIFVPAQIQPFKQDRTNASGYHRFAMAVLATETHEAVEVSPRELERGEVSYTVDTLEAMRAGWPDATIDWIIGDDNLTRLLEWRNIPRILELANFAVLFRVERAARQGIASDIETLSRALPESLRDRVAAPRDRGQNGAIFFAGNRIVDISATEIRRRVRSGEPIDEFVDPRVSRYIQRYRLYGEPPT